MTIAERVAGFIKRQAPKAFCDDCIATELALSRRQQAHRVTSALGTTNEYRRASGVCSECGKEKIVVHHA